MGGVVRSRGHRIYRVFDHTADLGLEIYGSTVRELFAHAAPALFDTIANLDTVEGVTVRTISVSGADLQDLFINYLRALLGWFHDEDFIVSDVTIHEITDTHVAGTATGERCDPRRHTIRREIKAVTYHMAEVAEIPGGWRGKVILDV
jgi:SHS2 domain-containing protein